MACVAALFSMASLQMFAALYEKGPNSGSYKKTSPFFNGLSEYAAYCLLVSMLRNSIEKFYDTSMYYLCICLCVYMAAIVMYFSYQKSIGIGNQLH